MSLESAAGVLLLLAAILAMIVANSPLSGLYEAILDTTVAVQIGALAISKPLLLWVAVLGLLVGKPLGILFFLGLAVSFRIARLP